MEYLREGKQRRGDGSGVMERYAVKTEILQSTDGGDRQSQHQDRLTEI